MPPRRVSSTCPTTSGTTQCWSFRYQWRRFRCGCITMCWHGSEPKAAATGRG